MIVAEIKAHKEPEYSYNYSPAYSSHYKLRPATDAEVQEEINKELFLYIQKDLRIGDRLTSDTGIIMEVLGVRTESTNTDFVGWAKGAPCCMLLKTTHGGAAKYSSGEINWDKHEKIGDRSKPLVENQNEQC